MARNGSLPEPIHFLMICLQVFTSDSAFPLVLLLYGLHVTCVMSHDSHNLAKAWQEDCGPLSETMVSGIPCRAHGVGFKFDRFGLPCLQGNRLPKVTVVVDSHEIVLAVVGE